jgi:hypothetical protein
VSEQKYDRFRRLERPRTGGPEEAPDRSGTDARIEAVEGPSAAAAPAAGSAASGGELGRFRAPPERALELDRPGDGEQPFLRCTACEADNVRHAARCATCGADLDTEPVRRFNQQLWAARRAEAAAEAEANSERRAQLERDAAELGTMRRQAAEALAREVGDAERRRLEQEGFGPGWTGPSGDDWTGDSAPTGLPPAIRWLRSLPPGWPLPVGLALLALPALLYVAWPAGGLVTGAVLLVLCTPPGWRTRRRTRPW